MPCGGQRLVQADLLGGHRLDLDDLGLAGGLDQVGDDPVGLVGVGGPVHVAARRGDRLLQLQQVAVEVAQRVVLDRACPPARSSAQSASSADDGGALAADGVRGLAEVARAAACRATALAGRLRGTSGMPPGDTVVGVRVIGHGVLRRVGRRISARCMVRTPVRWRRQRAADVHQAGVVGGAQHLGAGVERRCAPCRAHMAAETSGFFTAKVPPKPQHSSAPGSSTSSRPATARSSRSGRSPEAQHPQRVAGRVVGDPVREVRADVGRRRARRPGTRTARRPAATTSADGRSASPRRSPRPRQPRVVLADHRRARPDGATTAS